MFLESLVRGIIAFLFHRFQPRILYAKKFSTALNPTNRQDGSLGYDLYTPIDITLEPGERTIIDTGIIFEFPGYMGMFIWDKSSVAAKQHLSVCGGVIDSGYRGSVGVILHNCHPTKKIKFLKGTAIAQAVFHLTLLPTLIQIDENGLSKTLRGERAFGGDWEWHSANRVLRENDP